MRKWLMVLLLALCAGCSSWYQDRVDALDAKIAALRASQQEAATQEEVASINQQMSALIAERQQAMGGALQDSANKQALLMAVIGLGAQGLKMAGGAGMKGAGAAV